MSHGFTNVYDDAIRARAYAGLELPGTYWLAYRDLPAIIREHASGSRALDFGCGTGRSTRFLRDLGFVTVGVDIAAAMLERARELDPEGDYRLVPEGELPGIEKASFDLVFCSFTFDNIPGRQTRTRLFRILASMLNGDGRIVNLVSAPDIYHHEWRSFSTARFPENRVARSGDTVRIVMLDVEDRRPVEDVFWTDADYRGLYDGAGLAILHEHRPLGRRGEPFEWVSETTVSPWAIYVLGRGEGRQCGS